MDKYLLLHQLSRVEFMNRLFQDLARPLLAIVLFLLLQVVAGSSLLLLQLFGVIRVDGSDPLAFVEYGWLGAATFVCNIILVFICLRMFRKNRDGGTPVERQPAPWGRTVIALGGCILGVIAMDLLSEMVDLPNLAEEQMLGMCNSPWGILAIAVGAPVGEEVLFRRSIIGHLLGRGRGVAVSIVMSALLFGLAHMNPSQMFFASIMGILLGILYWRSGSLAAPILLHMLNNGAACLEVRLLGEDVRTFSLVQSVGGEAVALVLTIVLSLACAGVMAWYVKEEK